MIKHKILLKYSNNIQKIMLKPKIIMNVEWVTYALKISTKFGE